MKNFIIRQETEKDYKNTELMVMRAFWNIHGPGCNEHLLVRILRDSKDFIPELSRVAEIDGKIVGAIYYSHAEVVDGQKHFPVLTFVPLAVEPTLQNSGIGKILLEETFKIAKQQGYSGICIFGEPEYYPKIGFRNCKEFGITDPDGKQYDALMCYPLDEDEFSKVHGKLFESKDFEKCGDEKLLNAMNQEFPSYPKIKICEGFTQLFGSRIGVVTTKKDENHYSVKFWENYIPCVLDTHVDFEKYPETGDIVLFNYKVNDTSVITKVCKNLL